LGLSAEISNQNGRKNRSFEAQLLWFAFVTGLNLSPLANKLRYGFECLIAVVWAEPNSAFTGVGGLPATVIAHPAIGKLFALLLYVA
jgi:hypothetical protein